MKSHEVARVQARIRRHKAAVQLESAGPQAAVLESGDVAEVAVQLLPTPGADKVQQATGQDVDMSGSSDGRNESSSSEEGDSSETTSASTDSDSLDEEMATQALKPSDASRPPGPRLKSANISKTGPPSGPRRPGCKKPADGGGSGLNAAVSDDKGNPKQSQQRKLGISTFDDLEAISAIIAGANNPAEAKISSLKDAVKQPGTSSSKRLKR